MTFKDLEKWEQEGIIDSLKPGENPYVEYTKDDIIASFKQENQKLKKQQKEFIEWLENWLKILKEQFKGMRGVNAAYQRLIIDTVNETLSKYKEIIGDK